MIDFLKVFFFFNLKFLFPESFFLQDMLHSSVFNPGPCPQQSGCPCLFTFQRETQVGERKPSLHVHRLEY